MADVLVLDTSVLIENERRSVAAVEFVAPLLRRNVASVHPVTVLEMIVGARDRAHLASMLATLGAIRTLAVRNGDFAAAREMLERHTLASRIGWPDCLIAATCLRIGAPLVTMNDRDFRLIKGLRVVRPF